MQIFFFS